MKTMRFRLILMAIAVILLLIESSCSTQRYPAHRKGYYKGCNCPKF